MKKAGDQLKNIIPPEKLKQMKKAQHDLEASVQKAGNNIIGKYVLLKDTAGREILMPANKSRCHIKGVKNKYWRREKAKDGVEYLSEHKGKMTPEYESDPEFDKALEGKLNGIK